MSRSELLGGTEEPPPHLQLDLAKLHRFLSANFGDMPGELHAVKFKGGQSNPTYLLTCGDKRLVLRRRPVGKLQPSAHAIDREFRVMKVAHGAGMPVPQPLLYCNDESVIGSAFYIIEYKEGRVFWDADLPGTTPADRAAVYGEMNGVLTQLHSLDFTTLGLADFGRQGGYCSRNFARWAGAYDQSRLVDIADMDWLMEQLPKAFPSQERVTLIHGDYGLYNLIIDPVQPTIRAVLDWEMATLGDPLIDLAHHVRPWWDVPDPLGSTTSLVDKDLLALGIPSMHDYIASYCDKLGWPVPDMTFYLAFVQFRYAAMIQGILKRMQDGTASGRRLHRQERVIEIARLARATLEGGASRG